MERATDRYPVRPPRPPSPAVTGTPPHADGATAHPPTRRPELDRAIAELQAHKAAWTAVGVAERRRLIARLRRDFLAVSERWAAASAAACGLPDSGETSLTGPYFVLRNLRLLAGSLADIEAHGAPRIAGPVRQRPDGQVVARVFPQDLYDRLFYGGVTAEGVMEPGVTPANLAATQAVAYRRQDGGGVALVLGAGNVSSIGPMDALYKLFVEDRVVLYKAHPVNAYLGSLLDAAFAALREAGFFRLVYGGADEGAYLCAHPGVDEIHITGSDKTYEAIVFGPGDHRRQRKAPNAPRLPNPLPAQLGNVSPVIVVPAPAAGPRGSGGLGDADLAYQAENLVTMLTNNARFNCNPTPVIVQHAASPDRERLLAAMRGLLGRLPPRRAYYPGAASRYRDFVAAHPEAERFGGDGAGGDMGDRLPWTLIPGLDPAARGDV